MDLADTTGVQIKPVQKQTRAGQRTRFKAIVVIGDSEGHVGLGIKTSKEVATAIRAAIIIAKLSVVPIRRGYWGTNLGEPHSLPTKESGKCGSVTVRVCFHSLVGKFGGVSNLSSLSPPLAVLDLLPPPRSSDSCSLPVSRTFTLHRPDRPRLSKILSKPRSKQYQTPTVS